MHVLHPFRPLVARRVRDLVLRVDGGLLLVWTPAAGGAGKFGEFVCYFAAGGTPDAVEMPLPARAGGRGANVPRRVVEFRFLRRMLSDLALLRLHSNHARDSTFSSEGAWCLALRHDALSCSGIREVVVAKGLRIRHLGQRALFVTS